jgi:pilus assembly protein CpaE
MTNDIRLYRELMRRGVSEYLVAPFDPVNMIRSIAGLFTDPEAPFVGKTLAVTGVKGGVGASSIAHNLAWALSERVKVNATLIDLDLNFGTTGLDFNQDAAATIADALMSPDRFDDAVMGRLISKATDRLSLFTAPATLDRTFNLEPETYNRVLEQVRGSVPFVVLDLPHIWSDWFKQTVIGADEIVVVAAPDLASLRNGKNLIDFLKAARPNDAQPKLVLNMVGLPKRPEIPPKDFGQAMGVDPTLVLPFDAQLFGTAANNGQMIFDVAPDSKVAQGIDQLAALLTGKEIQSEKPSMLKKLLGK